MDWENSTLIVGHDGRCTFGQIDYGRNCSNLYFWFAREEDPGNWMLERYDDYLYVVTRCGNADKGFFYVSEKIGKGVCYIT